MAIVSPDGTVSACYLLQRDWEAQGLDLRLGRIEADGQVHLDAEAIDTVRRLNVLNSPACSHCFCRWHCAGGCHVNHPVNLFWDEPRQARVTNDRLCIQTRIIALRNILENMGEGKRMSDLLNNRQALEAFALQPSDALGDFEGSTHG